MSDFLMTPELVTIPIFSAIACYVLAMISILTVAMLDQFFDCPKAVERLIGTAENLDWTGNVLFWTAVITLAIQIILKLAGMA